MTGPRATGRALAGFAVVLALAVAAAAWRYRDVPAARLEAKYTTPASRFMHVDGVRIHYRDEGSGPAILLLHANFASLLAWEPWVDALAATHRVVRLDLPGFGLTGPDPTGNYGSERTLALTERFVDALGLRRFSIAGTSLGGSLAIRYAAKHPGRVERLVLLNPGILEGRAMAQAGRRLPAAARVLEYVTPRALAAWVLRSRAGDPSRITEEHVDRWWELWLREGNRRAMLARMRDYGGTGVAALLGEVRVPVLVLWGEANPQAPVSQAAELMALLRNAPEKRLVTYPGVGHPALEEAGARIARDVVAWLGGAPPQA
jgi:pimeloyl-ACP methyl ester carboxylesterase